MVLSTSTATVAGDFQQAAGCAANWDPGCPRTRLAPEAGGKAQTLELILPAGHYQAKVALDGSWTENYGAGGVRDGPNLHFDVPGGAAEVRFCWDPEGHHLAVQVGELRGDLGRARAHWLAPDLVAWPGVGPLEGARLSLHAHPEGGLLLRRAGVTGGTAWPLDPDPAGMPADLLARHPFLKDAPVLRLPPEAAALAPVLLRGQLAVSAVREGTVADATGLQLAGVLDALYGEALAASATALGPSQAGRRPTLRVWAPTARTVRLRLFEGAADPTGRVVSMEREPSGAWSVTGEEGWYGRQYLYEVDVYAPSVNQVVTNQVTDPWSVALSLNSRRSQLVSLRDPTLAPPGFWHLKKPWLDAFEDVVLYELHVRDFSQSDPGVPAAMKGSFLAFTLEGSLGCRHLRRLAQAGVTHVHLLPTFDFATVNDDRSTWRGPGGDLASLPPASTEQRVRTEAVKDADGYNWGYDPLHYTVPEGSYALQPEGPARTREFRAMVQALNRYGLRVVMDVVYNHTYASGQDPRSVLDRLVPGYYHRLDADGKVATSTCCANTASEHAMMRRLVVDSVVTWAREYKVDGFRLDLMGHHMKADVLAVRTALDALTLERDGVDGRRICLYGEGWDFGEVAGGARGVNATQANMAGTRIGTFSDRLRDALRGGGPFGPRRAQGLATGLYWDPNGTSGLSLAEERSRLDHLADLTRLGLGGNLADLALVRQDGVATTGRGLEYNGGPAGYAREPADVIQYLSAHDGETWFDALQEKSASRLSMDDRVRMHVLGMTVVALSQGIPFFHAGDEILRSKSGDANSYNSGDWWNKIDWTLSWNGWGSGLPPGGPDDLLAPLLSDPALRPLPVHMVRALEGFEEALRIRGSSRLFRLRTGAEIVAATSFYNQGPGQIPGLVVERISPPGGVPGDLAQALVVVNATPSEQAFADGAFRGQHWLLHPVQQRSTDPVVRRARFDAAGGAFAVPARTVAVFVSYGR
ncbi:MAG TPA: pullulanase-type alpha-1,6-glucosidase [Anaeromyxobacter sp.]|nr:pullulanase-type alpha-1,6-glucosidase [Anaeromyxobacter sp.]